MEAEEAPFSGAVKVSVRVIIIKRFFFLKFDFS